MHAFKRAEEPQLGKTRIIRILQDGDMEMGSSVPTAGMGFLRSLTTQGSHVRLYECYGTKTHPRWGLWKYVDRNQHASYFRLTVNGETYGSFETLA